MLREELQRLERQLARLTTPGQMAERIELLEEALDLVRDYPERWALYNVQRAEAYLTSSKGSATANIDMAIRVLHEGLRRLHEEEYPRAFGNHQHQLAVTFFQRTHGDRQADLERALQAAEEAVRVRRTDKAPHVVAFSLRVLAEVLLDRRAGDREENFERAIVALEECRTLFPADVVPAEWATTTLLLVDAYRRRPKCDSHVNYGVAIGLAQAVLPLFPKAKFPRDWANLHLTLAQLYRDQYKRGTAPNIEQAIAHYHQAVSVFTEDRFPTEFARIQRELGEAYLVRIEDSLEQNLDWALGLFTSAAKRLNATKAPTEWVALQMAIAQSYRWRLQGDANDNIEQGLQACYAILDTCAQQQLWKELVQALWLLAENTAEYRRGNRDEHREKAFAHLERAFLVGERIQEPVLKANLHLLRGRLLLERSRGSRTENIEHALQDLQAALTLVDKDRDGLAWGAAQHGLGCAYTQRLQGEPAHNSERAIAAFGQALQVRPMDEQPRLWAATMHALATALHQRVRGRAADNRAKAIKAHEDAFHIQWQFLLPDDWRRQRLELALLYEERKRLTPKEDEGHAEQCWRDIFEFLARDFPTSDEPRFHGHVLALLRRLVHGRRVENDNNGAILAYERCAALLPRRDLILANSVPVKLTETQQETYWSELDRWRLLVAWSERLQHTTTYRELRFCDRFPLRDTMANTLRRLRELAAYDPDFMLQTLDYANIGELARRHDTAFVYLLTSHDDDWGTEAFIIHPNSPADRLPSEDIIAFPTLTKQVVSDMLFARVEDVRAEQCTPSPDFGWLAAHARYRVKRDSAAKRLWQHTVRTHLANLSAVVTAPLVATLQEHGVQRVVLIPDPWLAMFPWHATTTPDGRSFAETCTLHYALSATAHLKKQA